MKIKIRMSELDDICDFILKSNNEDDFDFRFNHLVNVAVILFESEIENKNHLPFNSHYFINKLNNKLNSIVERINESETIYSDGYFINDIFIIILKEDYPEYFKNYLYQLEYRNN